MRRDKIVGNSALKKAAAASALRLVRPNMRLGIGTGSTAEEFIRLLAAEAQAGLRIAGVPTSERSRALCAELGVPLTDLEQEPRLDMTIDGADELNGHLQLIKGGGGALLREKIVAYASDVMVVIADESKLVRKLGAFPLPIEINPFGRRATALAVQAAAAGLGLKGAIKLRKTETGGAEAAPFRTDGGHYILDAHFGAIKAPAKLAAALSAIAGVVEHGLFFHPHCRAVLAGRDGTIKHIGGPA